MFDLAFKLESVCHLTMTANDPPEIIGATPEGVRVNGFISRGDLSGPKLRGKVRTAGCGDWAIVREDDVIEANARLTVETYDGALIYVTYTGIGLLEAGGTRKMLGGKPIGAFACRCQARMVCAHSNYAWVNRTQFLAIGEVRLGPPTQINYDIYAVD